MKTTSIIFFLLMMSCTNSTNDEDSELLIKTFSESLSVIIHEYYSQYNFHIDNTKITFEKKLIEFIPYIENAVKKDDQWLCGIRYEILLNNMKREEFTFGSVGVDASKEDAIATSIVNWIAYAGLPILDYFFNNNNSDTYLEIENYEILHGATGIRGDKPGSWLDGSKNMHIKILESIFNSINYPSLEVYGVSLEIFKEPNKTIYGECKINSRISEEALNYLKLLEWPDNSNYMLKQFYILSPK